jgi:hypothetical protein
MTPEEREQKQIAYLNLIITGQLMLGQLDALEGTNVYRGKLKTLVLNLMLQIETLITEDLETIWNCDEPALFDLTDKFKIFIHHMATLRTEHISGLAELLEQWQKMPELVLHRNGIKILTHTVEHAAT